MARLWQAIAAPGRPWSLAEHFGFTFAVTAAIMFLILVGYSS